MELQIQVDDKAVKNRLKSMPKAIDRISLLVTYRIARFGQQHIRANMPKDTGVSRDSIGYLVTKNSPGWRQTTITEMYSPHPSKTWNNKWFDLPWYMFDSPTKALQQKWRSGSIKNLRQTVPMLKERFEGDLTIQVRKEIKK